MTNQELLKKQLDQVEDSLLGLLSLSDREELKVEMEDIVIDIHFVSNLVNRWKKDLF